MEKMRAYTEFTRHASNDFARSSFRRIGRAGIALLLFFGF
jgi:hypothetical protein